jgi:magnesium transporter
MEIEWLLCQEFLNSHPREGAMLVERLAPQEAAALLEKAPAATTATVLQSMAPLSASECLAHLGAEKLTPVLSALPLEITIALLRRLSADVQGRLLAAAPAALAAPVGRLLLYPDGTAGALMDPQALALPEDLSMSEALARIRRSPQNVLYYLYVVNREGRLVGVLNLRELMLGAPKTPLAAAMRRNVAGLAALDDSASIVAHPGWRDFHALPVVDANQVFVGVIRYETLRRLETAAGQPPANQAVSTVLNLGELCWIGFAGMLTGLATSVSPPLRAEDKESDDGSKR